MSEPLKIHIERGQDGEEDRIVCKVGMPDGKEDFYQGCELCDADAAESAWYDDEDYQWAVEQEGEWQSLQV